MEPKQDDFEPPPYEQDNRSDVAEIDWERPPIFELEGSGAYATTSVVAQGKSLSS